MDLFVLIFLKVCICWKLAKKIETKMKNERKGLPLIDWCDWMKEERKHTIIFSKTRNFKKFYLYYLFFSTTQTNGLLHWQFLECCYLFHLFSLIQTQTIHSIQKLHISTRQTAQSSTALPQNGHTSMKKYFIYFITNLIFFFLFFSIDMPCKTILSFFTDSQSLYFFIFFLWIYYPENFI